MNSLICGSLAFDSIMKFEGYFSDLLLSDQLHKINISFLVPVIRREFGGCAGNIAYNLKLLGGTPLIMATIGGEDSASYLKHLKNSNISVKYIRILDTLFTAQCFLITDLDSNQINVFHPGAMSFAHENKIIDIIDKVNVAIISPDGRDSMLQHAKQSVELGIPLIFDPGYGLPMFNSNDLKYFINLATYIAVNDYEAQLLTRRTHLSLEEIAQRVSALIITRGALGAEIFTGGHTINIPSVIARDVVDPTGCGDAFRAGILFGLEIGMDWVTIGRLSSLMGAIKVASQGPQNHKPSFSEIDDRFYKTFGYRFI